MDIMIEVLYHGPSDAMREERITQEVMRHGGTLTYREEPSGNDSQTICLTYEFDNRKSAERAAERVRILGEHVEGPADYGQE